MRYSAEHKAATRQRVLETSGALIKRNGFAGTGVDQLMAAAGLTGGAFYSHFGSKAEFFGEVVGRELQLSREMLTATPEESQSTWLKRVLDRYLTMNHVRHPETGCALPSLGAEVTRAGEDAQRACEAELKVMKDAIAARVGNEEDAWALISQCVGAMLVARAVASEATARKILGSARKILEAQLGDAEPEAPARKDTGTRATTKPAGPQPDGAPKRTARRPRSQG